ncbi:MAG TPA: alpha/beta fold hydrolase [Longimicrobium sp.]|jgi:hypothetical protein
MCSTRRAAAALAALLLAPAVLAAQERGAFVITMRGDTLAVERFTRAPGSLSAEVVLRGAGRLAWTAALAPDASVTGMEFRGYAQTAAADAPPAQTAKVELSGDSARVTVEGGGNRMVQALAPGRGAIPVLSFSLLLVEQVLLRARALGGDGAAVPVFVVGLPNALVARVAWRGDSAVVDLPSGAVHARVDAAGRLLGARVPAQNLEVSRTAELALAPSRPDYSAPADAPYTAEEVRVPTPGGFRLAGTLTLPKERRGRVPVVVTISGSGQQDRDATPLTLPGYRFFRQVADTLGRRGIGVLRFDDRGHGESEGDLTDVTSADFAADVRAVVAYLRSRPEVDPERIALLGHSEGGVIAPLVAADDPRVAAVVLVAGTSRRGEEIIEYQRRWAAEHDSTVPPERRDSAVAAYRAQADSTVGRLAWWKWFMEHDPLPVARRLRQPVLVLHGAADRQVTADQAQELAAAIRRSGNGDVTVRVFPGVDHLLVRDPVGDPARYDRLPSMRVVPEFLGALADWLAAKLRYP